MVPDPDWACKKRRTLTRRPLDLQGRCPFSAYVTIGRREGSLSNEWFFIQGEAFHTGHYPPRVDALTKPTRLYSKEELQAVQDVLASYSGDGVAKSLQYYRTGEILSRSTLDWLKVFVFVFIFSLSFSIISFVCLLFSKSFSINSSYAYNVSRCLLCLLRLLFNFIHIRQCTLIRTLNAALQQTVSFRTYAMILQFRILRFTRTLCSLANVCRYSIFYFSEVKHCYVYFQHHNAWHFLGGISTLYLI